MAPTYDEIIDAQEELKQLESRYLRGAGWAYVCDMPGSQWLWRKSVNGMVVTVDTGSAIYMQRNMD